MAENNEKKQKIMERYLELPEDVQEALFAPSTSDAIFEVGKEHKLAIDKLGELADETGLVMLGMTKPSDFIKNLSNRIGVDAQKAKEIAEEINQKVFHPVRESLKKIHGIVPAPKELTSSPRSRSGVAGQPPPSYGKREGAKGEGVIPINPTKEGVGGGKMEAKKLDSLPTKIIMPRAQEKKPALNSHTEPIVKEKPALEGRIENESAPPQFSAPKEKKEEIEIPNIFVKKIPVARPAPQPDFVPTQEAEAHNTTQAKKLLEKELGGSVAPPLNLPVAPQTPEPSQQNKSQNNSDPYREPIE